MVADFLCLHFTVHIFHRGSTPGFPAHSCPRWLFTLRVEKSREYCVISLRSVLGAESLLQYREETEKLTYEGRQDQILSGQNN